MRVIIGLSICLLISNTQLGYADDAKVEKHGRLADAVKAFNETAAKDNVGKREAPLTEDEVVASLRLWDRRELPVSDALYSSFQRIAETGELPENAKLESLTAMRTSNCEFVVWWIDLIVMNPDGRGGYSYRIRDRRISSKLAANRAGHLELNGPVPEN